MKMIYLNRALAFCNTFFLAIILSSCEKKPDISGFDEAQWQTERLACSGTRSRTVDFILKDKKPWQGLDDDDIVVLLGRPERSYYYERNVRAFGYYLTPGKQCDSSAAKFGDRLIIEFNATGYSKRIFVEKD